MTPYEMQNRASGCAIDVWMQRNSGGASSHAGTAPSLIYIPLKVGCQGGRSAKSAPISKTAKTPKSCRRRPPALKHPKHPKRPKRHEVGAQGRPRPNAPQFLCEPQPSSDVCRV